MSAVAAFLVGHWSGEASREHWVRVGDRLLGVAISGAPGSGAGFELLRVRPDAYLAQPGGGAPVAFALVEAGHDAGAARWENPAHDFPKSIAYARAGDAMTARADTLAFAWTASPPPPPAGEPPPGDAPAGRSWWDDRPRPAGPAPACEPAASGVEGPLAWRVGSFAHGAGRGACALVWRLDPGAAPALLAAAYWTPGAP